MNTVLISKDTCRLVVLIGAPLTLHVFSINTFCFFLFFLTFCAGFYVRYYHPLNCRYDNRLTVFWHAFEVYELGSFKQNSGSPPKDIAEQVGLKFSAHRTVFDPYVFHFVHVCVNLPKLKVHARACVLLFLKNSIEASTLHIEAFLQCVYVFPQVTVAHINATAKNAADDKLRQSLRRFADTHTAPATVVLVSSKCDTQLQCWLQFLSSIVLLHMTLF